MGAGYRCPIVNVGLVTGPVAPRAPDAPRTNVVLPAPSSPSTSTTSPGPSCPASSAPTASVSPGPVVSWRLDIPPATVFGTVPPPIATSLTAKPPRRYTAPLPPHEPQI